MTKFMHEWAGTLCLITLALIIYVGVLAKEEKNYCGVVKHKVQATQWGKYHATADPVLVMALDIGVIYEVHPNWNTYLEASVGERMCFDLTATRVEEDVAKKNFIYLVGSFILFAIALIFGINKILS